MFPVTARLISARLSARSLAGMTAVGTLLAIVLLAGPLAGRASATTIPVVFPLENRVAVSRSFMTQRDGHLHQGIDLLAPKMTEELACVSGTVTLQVRMYEGLPWYTLWLAGDDGRGYYYSHINNDTPGTDDGQGGLAYAFAPGVHTGDHVTQGQFIAYLGDSGNAESSSPHLHFEIHETTEMSSPVIDPYDSLYTAPLADGTPGLTWPAPALALREQSSSLITYTGSWTSLAASGASGGTYAYTDSTASAMIWFQGTGLDLLATMGPDEGKAWLSLDGASATLVDFYSPSVLRQQDVWSSGPLSEGTHTIRLDRAGQASMPGGGTRVNIDALDVAGVLVQAPTLTTCQETNSLLFYNGTWTTSSTTSASGGSFGHADSDGSSVSAQFEGIYVSWTATEGPAEGEARLTLDNNPPVVVDLYSASTTYQQRVWTSGILHDGLHTVTIQWTGMKRAAASGTNINLDALQLLGGLDAVGATVWQGPTAGTTISPSGGLPPFVTGISPNAGSIYGGSSVTITGTYLANTSSVTFDGLPATGVSWNPAGTQLTCTTPTHAEGAVTVRVKTPGGSATTAYTYGDMPAVKRYDQTNSSIVTTGTWKDYPAATSYNGAYGRSSTSGASATIWFIGTRLDWIAMKGTTTGYADVYVDGVKVTGNTPVDLRAATPVYQQDVWSTGPLSTGLHSVRIVRSSSSTSGKFVTLDAVDIAGDIVAPPTRYQQTDGHIVKTGDWSNFSATKASGASYGRSLTSGATATITFNGSRLDWIAMKGTTTGYAKVYLDGVLMTATPIDLTATSASYQVPVWSTSYIGPPTVHVVRIERYVYPDGTGSAKYVTLDALDVWGTIQ